MYVYVWTEIYGACHYLCLPVPTECLYVCMCICVYVYIHIHISIHAYAITRAYWIYVCVSACTYIHACIHIRMLTREVETCYPESMYERVYVCMYMCVHMYCTHVCVAPVCVWISVWICVWICVWMCVCVYVCKHVYFTSTHTHTHTHTHTFPLSLTHCTRTIQGESNSRIQLNMDILSLPPAFDVRLASPARFFICTGLEGRCLKTRKNTCGFQQSFFRSGEIEAYHAGVDGKATMGQIVPGQNIDWASFGRAWWWKSCLQSRQCPGSFIFRY